MKMLRYLSSLALLVIAFPILAAAQSAQVAGAWDLILNTPNVPVNVKVTFKQEGDKLTGLLKSERGELPAQVAVSGKEIKINYTVKYDGNDLAIAMKGNVDGDAMKGTVDFGGLAEGDWTAKRAAEAGTGGGQASAPSAASGDKIDLTGQWTFAVETSAGSGSPSFVFRQEGETLTGQYSGALGEAPLKGTVKGNEINFTIEVSQGKLVYKGKIENGVIKGTVTLGDLGSGTFTGKRK